MLVTIKTSEVDTLFSTLLNAEDTASFEKYLHAAITLAKDSTPAISYKVALNLERVMRNREIACSSSAAAAEALGQIGTPAAKSILLQATHDRPIDCSRASFPLQPIITEPELARGVIAGLAHFTARDVQDKLLALACNTKLIVSTRDCARQTLDAQLKNHIAGAVMNARDMSMRYRDMAPRPDLSALPSRHGTSP